MPNHTAIIICGECGHTFKIALGLCSAIACLECRCETQVGETAPEEHNRMFDALERCAEMPGPIGEMAREALA